MSKAVDVDVKVDDETRDAILDDIGIHWRYTAHEDPDTRIGFAEVAGVHYVLTMTHRNRDQFDVYVTAEDACAAADAEAAEWEEADRFYLAERNAERASLDDDPATV